MIATRPTHIYEIYIKTTPERLWQAITDGADTARYFYGTIVSSSWQAGEPLVYRYRDGSLAADGVVLEVDPPTRLVHTFHALWDADTTADRPHRMTWQITQLDDTCRQVTHDDFEGETATFQSVQGGMSVILSGLKTLLETGQPLAIGG